MDFKRNYQERLDGFGRAVLHGSLAFCLLATVQDGHCAEIKINNFNQKNNGIYVNYSLETEPKERISLNNVVVSVDDDYSLSITKKIPNDIIRAIAMKETSSSYDFSRKKWIYEDKRRSSVDARGIFQMRYIAFKTVMKKNEKFKNIEKNHNLAQEKFELYLLYLKDRFKTWDKAFMRYNIGPSEKRIEVIKRGEVYAQEVLNLKDSFNEDP